MSHKGGIQLLHRGSRVCLQLVAARLRLGRTEVNGKREMRGIADQSICSEGGRRKRAGVGRRGKKVGKESGVCTKHPKTNTKEIKGSEQETKTRDRG